MPTGYELARMMKVVRTKIQHGLPLEIAKSMLEETKDNFAKSQYGNDDTPQRWPDRMGYRPNGTFGNIESYLNYKKLIYKGHLFRGIRPHSGMKFAELVFLAPYARMHNEGTTSLSEEKVYRRPPYSSHNIQMGRNPRKRQFAGVGRRTYKNVVNFYAREIKRLA